ncbi:DUF4303 domain-containing protein [Paludisphaera rhizosphaerae]|uniref:DUF4303 domain-containing protein n=1 Tax=Paludisphaera rhizosphaerae TaxID=2711216 RepID=UPI0013EA6D26|nr:DUF4303 domain-containing protein [Paludisphaera rhizosphaerae]
MSMDRSTFAQTLQRAIVEEFRDFRQRYPDETPYAFALILGQVGNWLGYSVATEQGLRRVAADYYVKGYRYQGHAWEAFDDLEKLSAWLRWANPDDGWLLGEFPDSSGVAGALAFLVESGAFGEDAEELEELCTDVLAALQTDADWYSVTSGGRVIVGVTYGEDPRDYLRTATRANSFNAVRRLWSEQWLCEQLSARIQPSDR